MSLQLPDGYTIFGTSNNGSTLTAVREGSTAAKPLLLIIDRNGAVYNATTARYSVPSFRVRVIRGTVDPDGAPKPERLLVDCNFRTPVGSSDEVGAILGDLISMISQPDFEEEGVVNQFFPTESTSA